MVDKYLEKFRNLKSGYNIQKQEEEKEKQKYAERQVYEEFKKGYKGYKPGQSLVIGGKKGSETENYYKKNWRGKLINPFTGKEITPKEKGDALAKASTLMSSYQLQEVLQGAKIYEKLGVGNRTSVKSRLLRAYEKRPEQSYAKDYTKEIESFLKRNPEKKESVLARALGGRKTLEHKFIPILAGASIIVALFFLSPNITGNVVGNLVKSDSNIIGTILFVLGIIGLFISFRKK